jgi:hypothetical protein
VADWKPPYITRRNDKYKKWGNEDNKKVCSVPPVSEYLLEKGQKKQERNGARPTIRPIDIFVLGGDGKTNVVGSPMDARTKTGQIVIKKLLEVMALDEFSVEDVFFW